MADAIESQMDPGYQLLACQYLREQLDHLAQHTQGARQARDIEDVHQARVASRRMRAALAMFKACFPRKKVKAWNLQIKAITGGLGRARDKDVQIVFVQEFLDRLTEDHKRCRAGIKRLHLRLCQQRQAMQPRVVKVLDRLDRSQVLGDMAGDLERMLFVLRARQVSVQTPVVWGHTAGQIQSRLTALLACQECLNDAGRTAEHHRMRILAKKLRYTLEICSGAYSKDLLASIKCVKRVQTLLGDIHDCDVWADQVDRFIDEEYRRTLEYFGHHRPFHTIQPGLDHLKAQRVAERRRLFSELQETWNCFRQEGVWDSLTALLQQYCGQSVPVQETVERELDDEQDDEGKRDRDTHCPDSGRSR